MKKTCKNVTAFILSLAMLAGNAVNILPDSNALTAKAATVNVSEVQGKDGSYFDAETGTLHLKGNVRNSDAGNGIILPNRVSREEVENIVAEKGTVLPENCHCLFYGFSNIMSVDLKNADASDVTDMSGMFSFNTAPKNIDAKEYNSPWYNFYKADAPWHERSVQIDIAGLDTSKVTNMSGMFSDISIGPLDLSSFDTSKVTDMSGMFYKCVLRNALDLSSFDTCNVTDMQGMFCSSLIDSVDLSSFDTCNVTNMKNMFFSCNFDALDLSSFDTSNVTDMSSMFSSCNELEKLDLSSFNTSSVTDMSYMFWCCDDLETIDVGDGWSTGSVASGTGMFDECYSLIGGKETVFDPEHTDHEYAHVDGGRDNPGYLTYGAAAMDKSYFDRETGTLHLKGNVRNSADGTGVVLPDGVSRDAVENIVAEEGAVLPADCSDFCAGLSHLKFADLKNADTSNVTTMSGMFSGYCGTELDLSNFDTSNVTDMSHMFSSCHELENLDLSSFDTSNVTDMSCMFSSWYHTIDYIDISGFDTSKVTDMSCMFFYGGCDAFDLSNFDTSNVTDMSCMFEYSGFDSIDLSSFDTSNVTHMSDMFFEVCVKSLDLSSFDTSNVIDMEYMFAGCDSLEELDLGSFDTSNVIDMEYMFACCDSLEELDLSNIDTSNVKDMSCMFYDCASLSDLDLSSFDTSNVKYMGSMFEDCKNLKTIIIGEGWSAKSVEYSTSMFTGCETLKGGAGTVYDEDHTDIEYAHVDGGKKDPGYFTAARTSAENNCNIVVYIPENTMNLLYDLYGNITDPKLKSLASSAKSFLNKFMTFKIV